MKLIDGQKIADELLGELFERGQSSGLWEQQLEIGALTYSDIYFADGYDNALESLYRQINEAEEIKAIPIEWIEKWFSQFYGEQGLEWNRCKRFMLKDWEKENAE